MSSLRIVEIALQITKQIDKIKCINNYTDMTKIGTLLSSSARTEILRALYYQAVPIGLRPLARIAGVLPRSAEVALSALVEEGVVCATRDATGPQYALQQSHADFALLAAVFTAATRAAIASRCRELSPRAARILPFIREAEAMVARGRAHVA